MTIYGKNWEHEKMQVLPTGKKTMIISSRLDMPKTFDLGFGTVVEVKYLERLFGVSRRSAFKYLRALRIELFYVGADAYFSLNTFKRILFVLSKPGAQGFIFPGARKKNDPCIRKEGEEKLTYVTDEILAAAADPAIIKEMAQVNSVSSIGLFRPPQRLGPKEKSSEENDRSSL